MAIIITFEAIPESHCKPEDDLEFVILKGNKGDILLRETMEDNLEGYPEIVYDTESSKVLGDQIDFHYYKEHLKEQYLGREMK